MAVGDLSFAFNPQLGETPQTIAAKRQLALAIMGNTSHAPHDIGEGLNAIGQALMYRNLMKNVNASESTGYNGATKVMASLFGGGDQNQFPAAPTATPSASTPSPSASAAPSDAAPTQTANADPSEVEAYIRQSATARGIDPDVAVKVASGEGGLNNPFRHGEGPAPRSQAPGLGATENSYGPLQLYVSGTGAGLGDRALAAGIDPRKDWKGGVDFALDEASKKGWGQWYGAKAQGITGMQGIGQAPATAPQMAGLNLPGQAPIPQAAPVQVASNDASVGMPQASPLDAYTASGIYDPAKQFRGKDTGPKPVDPMVYSDPTNMPDPLIELLKKITGGGDSAPQSMAPDRQMPSGAIPPSIANAAGGMPAPLSDNQFDGRFGPSGASAQMMPGSVSPALPYAPQPAPNDAKAAIAQAMAGQGGGVPASAPAPAAQKIAAALMQQQALTGGAPMGMQAPTGAPVPPQALPSPAAAAAPQQVAQAATPPSSPQGSDLSQLPAMAGGNSDVVQPGSMPRTGPTPQQLIEAAGNPWVMQRYGPIVDAMISQQMTPHKLEMVPLGNGITAEIDSLTGKQVGQIKGQPDLKSIKDAAGNEYMFNPADPTHPITVDTLLGGGGQAGGQAAPNGQADPYASPFPRTIARTDVMKDYEGYLAQSKSLNQPPMSFNDYQMNLKKEGAQSVVFNQENAANKAVGEAVGNNMADYINGAKDARSKLQALDMIKGVLDKYGDNISTGPGANTMLSIKQAMANVFPSMADAPGPTEMLQKLSTQLATADAKGLASRPTQFDFATYLKNNPGIQMSIQGQKALVDLKLQQAQHDYELGSMATHKQYANDPGGWADVVAKYDQEHPLINPLTGKPADASATDFPAPKDGAQAAPSAAPVAGAKQAPDGNWYVPDPNRPGKYLKVVQ